MSNNDNNPRQSEASYEKMSRQRGGHRPTYQNNQNNQNRHFNHRGPRLGNKENLDEDRRNNPQRSYQRDRAQRRRGDEEDERLPKSDSKSPVEANGTSNRRKLLSISSSTSAATCICCLHELYTFVYYSCSHFVCLNCAIKMRFLLQKTDCPVCRQESPKVLCTKNQIDQKEFDALITQCRVKFGATVLNPFPSCAPRQENAPDLGIYLEQDTIWKECEEVLESRCDYCSATFSSLDELDRHLRKIHFRFYCELCLGNLKMFPYERKSYNREELAIHKRQGDPDDYSFKGHPNCHYCDERYFDRDELYRHYRKEHFYCHFCDSDGVEEYYKDYAELREHFLGSHFLCELEKCSANAEVTHEYVVFRTELDFQAHKKQVHAKTKSESKSFGKLNIEFNVSNPARDRQNRQRNRERIYENDDELPQMSRRPNQSKISTIEVEPMVLQASKEQFERDEEERRKQRNLQRMKEQYEKYEQSQAASNLASSLVKDVADEESGAAAKPPSIAPPEPIQPTAVPPVQISSTWSNKLGKSFVIIN